MGTAQHPYPLSKEAPSTSVDSRERNAKCESVCRALQKRVLIGHILKATLIQKAPSPELW